LRWKTESDGEGGAGRIVDSHSFQVLALAKASNEGLHLFFLGMSNQRLDGFLNAFAEHLRMT